MPARPSYMRSLICLCCAWEDFDFPHLGHAEDHKKPHEANVNGFFNEILGSTMDPGDTDWSRWSTQSDMESGLDMVKNEDSVISSETRSDNIGDGSNLGADDDYMTSYGLYDGYDSYNEVSESSDEGEGVEQEVVQESPVYTPPVGQKTEYRFMNGKDGMATCEMCGAIGIKHAFYSKSKRFCSLACSRGFAAAQKEGKLLSMQNRVQVKVEPGTKSKPKYTKPSPVGNSAMLSIGGNSKQGNGKSFDWATFLSATNAQAASVGCFGHCPMADCWENINEGMKVEVINHDCPSPNTVYWIATVIKAAGYKAQLRYEGYGNDQSNDYWINLCSEDVHPVGWCATIGKPLVPPQTIQHKYSDWKDFLVRRLTGARTLPSNFYNRVIESIHDHKFKKGVKVEVVDKMCVSAMRVAIVDEVIGGRLRLQYQEKIEENDDFWCHMRSSLLHPVGWSQHVGHNLHASQEYKSKSLGKVTMQKYDPEDATPDMFRPMKELSTDLKFQVGMKLEAIDPLNLATICVSTVMKVLKDNYLMIGIDGSMAQSGSDWFCYHGTSPCIFPAGFCEINDLDLTPPKGYKGQFKWFDYLRQSKSSAAPVKLFDKEIPKHGFKPGMKVEAVDLMEPRLICVGTVVRVVGRLLRIHFDGWESDYDQWVDCETPDLYPVGWSEMMGYNLEGPRVRDVSQPSPHIIPKKRKGKTQIYRGPRKKRKPKGGGKPVKVLSDKTNQRTALPFHVKTEQQFSLSNELMSATLPPLLDQGGRKPGDAATVQLLAGKAMVNDDEMMETDAPPALSPQSPGSGAQSIAGINGQMPELAGHITDRSPDVIKPLLLSKLSNGQGQKQNITKALVTLASPTVMSSPTVSPVSVLSPGMKANPKLVSGTVGLSSLAAQLQAPQAVRGPGGDNSSMQSVKATPAHIPRIISAEDDKQDKSSTFAQRKEKIVPQLWSVFEVCQFLRTNDCGAYCDSFSKKNIDGPKFLTLTKEQIVNLTGMKVGPSLKIYDLIQQLKVRVSEQSVPDT